LTDLPGREQASIRALFKTMVQVVEEQYDTARELVQTPLFARFGLADAAVGAVCQRKKLVLTADLKLQIALESLGLDALNFNHLRALSW